MSKVVLRECRFVFHVPLSDNNPDTHIVKELLTMEDGTTKKNLRTIINFKRPFWVTKEHKRNHKQKKESELLDNLIEGKATESELARHIAVKLGSRYNGVTDMRKVSGSPYVYGTDINSRTYIKQLYQDKYPNGSTPYEVCVFDIETDTYTDEITIISLTVLDKIHTIITKKYLKAKATSKDDLEDISNEIIPKLEYLYDKHIPKTDITKSVKREYTVVENSLEAVRVAFKTAHKWKPDLMVAWNHDYELTSMLDLLRANRVNPADVFCDPDLPKPLRTFKYKRGQEQKVTASGKVTPIDPEMRWHTVYAPASFYWLDAMAGHRYIRVGGKSIPGGYNLDNILKHELGDKLGKLKFENSRSFTTKGIDWHKYMTSEMPLEYITYNQWDVLSILELDNKTKDLKQVLPMLSGISNFDVFNSGPKRIVDALHFFYLENGKVLGTRDPRGEDSDLLGLGSWIVLLPSYRVSDNGVHMLEHGMGNSNVRLHVYDSDQVSGYPRNTRAANVSMDTTLRELKSIDGIPISIFREHNINLLFGEVNALAYGSAMFGLPKISEIMPILDNM